MVPLVRHVGAMEGPERAACYHRPVYQGGGLEETAVGGRVNYGESVYSLSVLWEVYRYSHIL